MMDDFEHWYEEDSSDSDSYFINVRHQMRLRCLIQYLTDRYVPFYEVCHQVVYCSLLLVKLEFGFILFHRSSLQVLFGIDGVVVFFQTFWGFSLGQVRLVLVLFLNGLLGVLLVCFQLLARFYFYFISVSLPLKKKKLLLEII